MISLGMMLDDARQAVDMFEKLKVPVIGLIENMSLYICPECGHEAHVFGHGGGADEAQSMGVPLLAQLLVDLETRLGSDGAHRWPRPAAMTGGESAGLYAGLARKLT